MFLKTTLEPNQKAQSKVEQNQRVKAKGILYLKYIKCHIFDFIFYLISFLLSSIVCLYCKISNSLKVFQFAWKQINLRVARRVICDQNF